MIKVFDRIKELSTTIGSGNLKLEGAFNGFRPFSYVYSSGDFCYYALTAGNNYEIGSGQYIFDGSNHWLARFPFNSTNSNNIINLPNGTKEVFVTYPAKYAVYLDGQNLNVSGSISANSGIFSQKLQLNGTDVSLSGHSHTSNDISNFNSAVSGILPITNIVGGPNISVTTSGATYTIGVSGQLGLTAEQVDDRVSNLLNAGQNIVLNYNDNGDSLTISTSGLQPSGNYSSVGHTHVSSDITDFNSAVSGLIPPSNFTSLSGVSGIVVTNNNKNYIVSLNDPTIQLVDITDLLASARTFLSTPSSSNLSALINDETGSGLLVFNNSPSFDGIPTAPTASSGNNTSQIANTAFVRTEISNLVNSAPANLDTLNELANALGNDANFSTTVINSLAAKANLNGATFTGSVTIPSGNGNFNTLSVDNTPVSVSGHKHTSSDINDFNVAVSGLVGGYVPYVGASGAVNLGANAFTASRATLATGTITASTPAIDISQTWNNAATTFTGILANVTDTASNASSLLLDLQVGGSSKFKVDKTGGITIPAINTGAAQRLYASSVAFVFPAGLEISNGPRSGYWNWDGLTLRSDGIFSFASSTSVPQGNGDTCLLRDAADTLAQRRSTNAQTFRLYGTYTDASNYRRLFLSSTTAGAFTIGVEGAGTGASGNTLTVANATTFNQDISLAYTKKISFVSGGSIGNAGGVGGAVELFGQYIYLGTGSTGGTCNVRLGDYGSTSLNIYGTNSNTATFTINAGDLGNPGVGSLLVLKGGNGNGAFGGGNVRIYGGAPGSSGSNGNVLLAHNGTSEVGNVGIGITSPTSRLDISDTTGAGSGSLAASALNVTQTWNTTGTPTLIKANVTDTASNANSLLLDLQVGGSSKFSVNKNGPYVPSEIRYQIGATNTHIRRATANELNNLITTGDRVNLQVPTILSDSGFSISNISTGYSIFESFNTGIAFGHRPNSVALYCPSSWIIEQRFTTNPQTFRIYNTYTDSSNYERGKIAWESNVLRIGTEKAGTGSARALELQTDGVSRLLFTSDGSILFSGTNAADYGILSAQSVRLIWGRKSVNTACLSQDLANGHLTFIRNAILSWSGSTSSSEGGGTTAAILSNAAGIIEFNGGSNSTLTLLRVGGATSSFPAIKRNAAALNFRLADDSGDCDITAKNATFSGALSAVTKSFLIDHPSKPGTTIEYGSLESPYHGIRLTGRATINNNQVTVELPDYISDLVYPEDINIQITNYRHGNILWVEDIDIANNKFMVCGNASGPCEFFWSFTAIRRDVDRIVVEKQSGG